MSSSRDQWLRKAPARATKRLNKIITLPAFSAACGFNRYGLYFAGGASTAVATYISTAIGSSYADFVDVISIELWVKPLNGDAISRALVARNQSSLNVLLDQWQISISDLKIIANFSQAGAYVSAIGTLRLNENDWNHVAVTFDNTSIKIYINGVLDSTTAMAGNFDAVANRRLFIGAAAGPRPFTGYIQEVRIWHAALTLDQIINRMHCFRDISGLIDVNLVSYYKFLEGAGATTADSILAVNATINNAVVWQNAELFPFYFGASFVAKEFNIANDNKSSLKFPLVPPDDVDFSLVILWLDSDGIYQRRTLWTFGNFSVNPVLVKYNGERLPEDFVLECWTTDDGSPTINLTEDFTIETSITSQPNQFNDYTQEASGTVTGDTTLAAAFPFTPFPVVFDTQQTY